MKITAQNKKKLAEARELVAAALKGYESADASLPTLQADETALNAAVERLESDLAHDDEKGVANLETKRAQLGLLRRRIEAITQRLEPLNQAVYEALRQVQSENTIGTAMEEEFAALKAEIVGKLLPYCDTKERAAFCAQHTSVLHSFANFYMQRRYDNSPPHAYTEARAFLRVCDALLADKHAWKFVAAQTAA